MAPKRDLASVLFHQKKKPAKDQVKANGVARKPRPPPKPASQPQPEDTGLDLPDGPFTEFKLLSSNLNGWKYDVMKFDSRKNIDILSWQAPIKLNRKDVHRDDVGIVTGPPVKPMLGLDGKPVIGPDGKIVMVDAEGRVVQDTAAAKNKGVPPAKKKFQKKTRQVFLIPEATKQLRKEERYPWVIEDSTGKEVWTAQLDDTSKADTQCFFMPAANESFKFVPAHRWYKFQKKLHHTLPTDTANVESAYQKHQKRDPTVWLQQRTGKKPSVQTAAMFKAEEDGSSVDFGKSLVHSSSHSLGPGGRKLKTVDSGVNGLFGDDEDGDAGRRRREKEFGGEGDIDEVVFEEEFADDEEKMDIDNDDEEAKELEERLKKEYKAANKTREGFIDESEDEDTPQVSKAEKRMQKLIRNREGNDAYESDDEKNPYASSDESSDEEVVQPVTQPTPQSSQANETLTQISTPQSQSQPSTESDVRATSPGSPALGGHSVLAKRATSPKPPKIRATSPRVSRPTSPVPHSRATSPTAGSRAASPFNGKKRKSDDTNGAGQPKKKRKAPGGELEAWMLVEWLKNTPNATTRLCIQQFQPYINGDAGKTRFTQLVKEVALMKGGNLMLRAQYANRGGSSAPSPS